MENNKWYKNIKIGGQRITLVGMFLFTMLIATIGLYSYTYIRFNKFDMFSFGINILFFLGILLLCHKWKGFFYNPLKEIISDLNGFEEFIKSEKVKDYDSVLEYVRLNYKDCFKTDYAKDSFEKYLDELDKLEIESAEEYSNCDISDFLNYESASVYIKKNTADNIASAMTGVGILGTFVGLTIGLQKFNASDSEAMAESIVPLIDGIKTAFYTSIYGVVMSLGLNYMFKKELNELDTCFSDFYDCYYENVLSYSEYMLEKKTIDIQEEQKELFKSFSESIAITLSTKMKEVMDPVFVKFSDSIEDFSKTVALNQVEGLEKIVDNFVTNMNNSLGDQFDKLGNIMKESCEWQEMSVSTIKEMVSNVTEEAEKVSELNNNLGKTVEKFDGYLKKLHEQEENLEEHMKAYIEVVNKAFDSMKDVSSEMKDVVENEKQIVEVNLEATELLKENSNMIVDSQKQINENVENFTVGIKNSINEITEHTNEKIETIDLSLEKINNGIENSVNGISDISSNLHKYMESFTSNIEESIDKVIEYTDDKIEVIDLSLEEINNEIENSAKGISNISSSLHKFMNSFTNNIEKSINKVIEYTDEKISNITKALNNIDVDMVKSAENLSNITGKLHEDIETYLNRTFKNFDNELANMAGYFGGALADINENTEKIPRIVSEGYDQLKKQTETYISVIAKLENEIKEAVDNVLKLNELTEAKIEKLENIGE